MDNSILTEISSYTLNNSEETNFSFLNIDLTEEILSSDNKIASFKNKNLSHCILRCKDTAEVEDFVLRLELYGSTIDNVIVNIESNFGSLELIGLNIETLTINIEDSGHLSSILFENVKAKNIIVNRKSGIKESIYHNSSSLTVVLADSNYFDNLVFKSEQEDEKEQLKLGFCLNDFSESVFNTLNIQNFILKNIKSYWDNKDESPEVVIHNLKLKGLSLEYQNNLKFISSNIEFYNSLMYGKETEDFHINHLEAISELSEYLVENLTKSTLQELTDLKELSSTDVIQKFDCYKFSSIEFRKRVNVLLTEIRVTDSIRSHIWDSIIAVRDETPFRITQEYVNKVNTTLYNLCHITEPPDENTVPVFEINHLGELILKNKDTVNSIVTNHSYTSIIRMKRNNIDPIITVNQKAYAEYRTNGGVLSSNDFHNIRNTDRSDRLFRNINSRERQRFHNEYNETIGSMTTIDYERMYSTVAGVPPGVLNASQELPMYYEWKRRQRMQSSRYNSDATNYSHSRRLRTNENPYIIYPNQFESISADSNPDVTRALNILSSIADDMASPTLRVDSRNQRELVRRNTDTTNSNPITEELRRLRESIRFDPGQYDFEPNEQLQELLRTSVVQDSATRSYPRPTNLSVWLDESNDAHSEINIFSDDSPCEE